MSATKAALAVGAVFGAFAMQPASAGVLTALSLSGFTQSIVIPAGPNYSFPTATMDYGTVFPKRPRPDNTTWYAQGVKNDSTGLPMGTTFAAADDPNTTFALQSATALNAVLLEGSAGSATVALSAPMVFTGSLAFLTASGNGSSGFEVFGDLLGGGTVDLGHISSPDWFAGGPIAYVAGGRGSVSAHNIYDYGVGQNPFLYDEKLNLSGPTAALTGFTLTWNGGSNTTVLMGISGQGAAPAPEPTSIALLATGFAALGFARRRKGLI